MKALRRLAPKLAGHGLALFFKRAGWVFAAGLLAGVPFGLFLTRSIPEVDSLQFTQPPLTTRIFSRDGEVLQEYGAEKRILVRHAEISPNFFLALIAVEDSNFYKHHGISPRGIMRAFIKDVLHLRLGQGGSTLTQQLARRYFLTDEKTFTRKLREMILAVNIERNYSKEQILEMYSNKVYFGHGRYGIESASNYFFAKPSRDLSLLEASLLAGLVQRPIYFSPRNHADRAKARRDWVLKRLSKTGVLSKTECARLQREPIRLAKPPLEEEGLAAYVSERIRMYCEQKYGEEALYEQGYQIFTTLDSSLQALAQAAIRDGLHEYNRRHGYLGPRRGPEAPQESAGETFQKGERRWATVEAVRDDALTITSGGVSLTLGPKDWAWARNLSPAKVFEIGDRVLIFVKEAGASPLVDLDQEPVAQAALLAMDPPSGEVRALVGGYDFATSMFNRVIQAKRQTGSAVKPLIYVTALQQGRTLADSVVDEPKLLLTGRERPETICSQGYTPHNFDPDHLGYTTYRRAIEQSVNIAAVQVLNGIGYAPVIETAGKLHISSKLRPYPSLALGAFEITLWELTAAFSALDNGGVWIEPRFMSRVADREGRTLEEFRSATSAAIDPAAAYVMIQGMTGVVKRGTAASLAGLPGHFAGKTGTTNDYTDSWFIGFNPALVCGVWAGRDDHKPLGRGETGARVALPIWKRFMEPATEGQANLDFKMPPGVTKALIDPRTGLRAGMDSPCSDVAEEFFIEGTEPSEMCSEAAHFRLKLPYYLQSYQVKADGSVSVPADDIESLVQARPALLSWSEAERRLSVTAGGVTFPVRVDLLPAREGSAPEAVIAGLPPEGSVRCGARVEYIHEQR